MDQIYPPSPDVVVEDITAPGPTYKKRARIALLSLLLFIALYLSLTAWFGWTAYKYFVTATESGHGPLVGFGLAAAAALLTVFLVKALFFVNRGGEVNDMEVSPEEQPQLFEFLYRLADEAGAPRPNRVFLSGRVNAAVFYDLTLLNLVFPSKKNLEIGLALVNGLNLGEFKAVLAHEFGHFRQGSMAVGRWVYVAQQIANHIVYQRDIIDKFLVGLSRFDLRIAWIGWILRLIVWALRAILDTAFSLVVLAQRSLSREMEFHADMVSASLTGSDALVHALHRLGAADDAWGRALSVAGKEMTAGRAVTDVFVIQKVITGRMKDILDDENHDRPPELPAENRDQHRIFDMEQAHPPRMWSTHPPNRDREENVKKLYIPAPIDDRPAWDIFNEPQQLRERMTEHLLTSGGDTSELKKSPLTETLAGVNETYSKVIYDRKYRGCYMGRSIVRDFERAAPLMESAVSDAPLPEQFAALYPEELSEQFEHWRNLEDELATLRALRDGQLESADGVIRHRGDILKRRQLPDAIESMREECGVARQALCAHDCQVRSVHSAAAKSIGNAWPEYHSGLVKLLHYADHTAANLADVHGRLANLWSVVIADGKVSSSEVKQLLVVTRDMHTVLHGIESHIPAVTLSDDIAAKLKTENWRALLNQDFGLPEPTKDNLGDWLDACDGWVNYFLGALTSLQEETLEGLLAAESRIEAMVLGGEAVEQAPNAAAVPDEYSVLLPNTERKLQTRLGLWDRFQTADGLFPAMARFGVAAVIVGGLLGLGTFMAGSVDVTVYNGLATAVSVKADGETVAIDPLSQQTISVSTSPDLEIQTHTSDGFLVESINVDSTVSFGSYVYNVGAAAPLVRWTAVYGSTGDVAPVYLGAKSWFKSNADFLFDDPPESINTSGSGSRRTVLSAFDDLDPRYLESYMPDGASTDDLIRMHASWDHSNSRYIVAWLSLALTLDEFPNVIESRLRRDEKEVMALRFQQESAGGDEAKDAVCERHKQSASAEPESSDLQYLAIRCLADGKMQSDAFLAAFEKAPENGWLAAAAGFSYAEVGNWSAAVKAFEAAYGSNAGMRLVYADELARARRMFLGQEANVSDLASASAWIEADLLVRGDELQTQARLAAHQLLWRGELDAAVESASSDAALSAEILRFAAASDAASQQLISSAKALDTGAGITQDTLWIALGFARRHRLPTGELLQQADVVLGTDATYAREFLAALDNPGSAEETLNGSRSYIRGSAYAMATVALGTAAPIEWREGAKRLLYATERPNFD